MDITKTPLNELINDRCASIMDVKLCECPIVHGHTEYGNEKSTQRRLDINQSIIKKIDVELEWRKMEGENEITLRTPVFRPAS